MNDRSSRYQLYKSLIAPEINKTDNQMSFSIIQVLSTVLKLWGRVSVYAAVVMVITWILSSHYFHVPNPHQNWTEWPMGSREGILQAIATRNVNPAQPIFTSTLHCPLLPIKVGFLLANTHDIRKVMPDQKLCGFQLLKLELKLFWKKNFRGWNYNERDCWKTIIHETG